MESAMYQVLIPCLSSHQIYVNTGSCEFDICDNICGLK